MTTRSKRTTLANLELKRYVPCATARLFHASDALFRGIRGPIGSGKSVACCMEVYSRSLEAAPYKGLRKSRWAFVRSTYSELISTTMKTWSDWVPTQLCPITFGTVITGRMIAPLSDDTQVDLEIIFLSMDREEDVSKMKSLELTGVWFNEAGDLLKSSVEAGISRTSRFPNKLEGGEGRWFGAIADTNPPPDDSWWYDWAEVSKPERYEFFSQPPAVIRLQGKPDEPPQYVPNDGTHGISKAENVEWQNIGYDYWLRMVPGRDEEWIKVYLMGQYGTVQDGRPVYGNLFNDALHTAKTDILPVRGLPLVLGWDFGLNASCAFIQFTPKGELRIIDEVTSEETGIQQCVRELVRPKLNSLYAGMKIYSVGDPAGAARSQTTEQTCLGILHEEGIPTESAPTNEFVARREAVAYFLTRMVDGKPCFQLSPKCDVLRKGFLGRYQYRRMQVAGKNRFTDRPEKNEYSHIHDALQYGALFLRAVKPEGGSGHLGRSRRPLNYGRPDAWA
jgi:hypothetical protein